MGRETTASRRHFLQTVALATPTAVVTGWSPRVGAQTRVAPATQTVQTPILTVGFEQLGSNQGFPVILLHGFPDDVRAWDEVAPPLVKNGYRVLVPYLRGYGPTRFREAAGPRMAEQAAIGQDLLDLADALRLPRFAVAGYDWGGRAAGIAAALYPDRVRAAVLIGGYTIQDTIAPPRPGAPETERALWYQWYLLKTGAQGNQLADADSEKAYRQLTDFVTNSGRFHLVAQRPVPDGSTIALYRQN